MSITYVPHHWIDGINPVTNMFPSFSDSMALQETQMQYCHSGPNSWVYGEWKRDPDQVKMAVPGQCSLEKFLLQLFSRSRSSIIELGEIQRLCYEVTCEDEYSLEVRKAPI